MKTLVYCSECTQFLAEYGPIADIYGHICEMYLEKWLDNLHLMMVDLPGGNLSLDFLERSGYLITHEMPADPTYYIVKPSGIYLRGDEFKICTCDCPKRFRKH